MEAGIKLLNKIFFLNLMTLFKHKKITLNNETLGEQLSSARKKRKESLKKISQELKINEKYLEALEKGDFNQLPKGLYAESFLKEYSFYLGLNIQDVLELFQAEKQDKSQNKKIFIQKSVQNQYFLSLPKIFKNLFIIVLVVLCLTYIGHYINNIISPPQLLISYPLNDLHTKNHSIIIKGKSDPEAEVNINGKKILLNQDGSFNLSINLKNGLNNINIIAQKKYSKKNIITRKVILE